MWSSILPSSTTSGDAPTPDTVNPSLWRQSQVISQGGLYEVTDGVYQVRNNDIANLTVVEGDDGSDRHRLHGRRRIGRGRAWS